MSPVLNPVIKVPFPIRPPALASNFFKTDSGLLKACYHLDVLISQFLLQHRKLAQFDLLSNHQKSCIEQMPIHPGFLLTASQEVKPTSAFRADANSSRVSANCFSRSETHFSFPVVTSLLTSFLDQPILWSTLKICLVPTPLSLSIC